MIATIYISGKIGTDTTLVDVIRQFKSFEEPESVLAVVDSVGGSKEEGDAIYNYLDGLKKQLPVNTYAKKAYSISAKIFAVGQERTVDDVEKAIMIHFAWAKPKSGTADYFEAIASALREMETEFTEFYSNLLDIDEDTIRNLLDNETFVSGSDAVELNFATKIKVMAEAVAEFDILNTNININKEKMIENKSKKKAGQKLLEAMAAFVGFEVKAELTLQDSDGSDIVFPDLESGDTPKEGDAATKDGSVIPDGSYIMPSLEEATVVFVDGKVSEIVPKEKEEEKTEEKTEVDAEVDAEASFEELLVKVSNKVKAEISAEFEAKLTVKDNEIKALNKKIGSKEFKAEAEEVEAVVPARKKSLAEILQTKRK